MPIQGIPVRSRMDIQQIKEFITLAKILNLSRAAEILYMSQPTLSRHLAEIERELATGLFTRTKQEMVLTPAGSSFLEDAKKIVEIYDRAIENIKAVNGDVPRNLGVGILYYQTGRLLDKISLFKHAYPFVTMSFVSATPNEIIDRILDGSIDVGETMNVEFKNSRLLEFFDLYTEPLAVMVNQKHPLAERKSVSAAELHEQTFVNVNDAFYAGYFRAVRKCFARYGLDVKDPLPVDDYEMMLLSVQVGQGIAVVTKNMTRYPRENCAYIDIENDNFLVTRSIAYRRDNTNPMLARFVELFKGDAKKRSF